MWRDVTGGEDEGNEFACEMSYEKSREASSNYRLIQRDEIGHNTSQSKSLNISKVNSIWKCGFNPFCLLIAVWGS